MNEVDPRGGTDLSSLIEILPLSVIHEVDGLLLSESALLGR